MISLFTCLCNFCLLPNTFYDIILINCKIHKNFLEEQRKLTTNKERRQRKSMSPFFLNHAASSFSFSFFGSLTYRLFSFFLTSSDSVRPASKSPVLMAREM